MWLPRQGEDGHDTHVSDEDDGAPFFVPSDSSADDDDASTSQRDVSPIASGPSLRSGVGAYQGTPIHRQSITRSSDILQPHLVQSRAGVDPGMSPVSYNGSFSPELTTTTSTRTATTTNASRSKGADQHHIDASHHSYRHDESDEEENHHHHVHPHGLAFVSMDDLLFGSTQQRQIALRRRRAEQQKQQHASTDHPMDGATAASGVTTDHGSSRCANRDENGVWKNGTAASPLIASSLVNAAGGGLLSAPRKRTPPCPKSLDVLRSMTSADVRGVLEPFFLQKEDWEARFRQVERDVLPQLFQEHNAAQPAPTGATNPIPPVTVSAAGEADVRVRDRCARIVNIRGWFAPTDHAGAPNTTMDVLLPASLVPLSPFHAVACDMSTSSTSPSHDTAASTSTATATAPARQLRRHQINGIRFMWNTLVESPVGQVPTVGSILAHTMGLGKTGQVIVFLHLFMQCFHTAPRRNPLERSTGVSSDADRRDRIGVADDGTNYEDNVPKPQRVLIVVPKSTISSWTREFDVWSPFFAPTHRIRPRVIADFHRPEDRLRHFYEWRQVGGVLLVGYESFVRVMEQVETQSAFDGLGSASTAFGLHRGRAAGGMTGQTAGLSGDAAHTDGAARQQQSLARRMAYTRRLDEGDVTYGGRGDPFTELVVCDEAHRLKSVHLRVVAALRGLHPLRRLLLTGTPLQNHLQEYWSMMDFCLHKYFDRLRFKSFFSDSIESTVSKLATSEEVQLARNKTFTLINEVRHFVQRVDSSPLRHELPPLHEYVVVLKLSPLQTYLYAQFLRTMRRHRSETAFFLPAVAHAGKITAHPQLFYDMFQDLAGSHRMQRKGGLHAASGKKAGGHVGGWSGGTHTRKRPRAAERNDGGQIVETIASSSSSASEARDADASDYDLDTTSSGEDQDGRTSDDAEDEDDVMRAREDWAVVQRSSKYSLSSLYRVSVENKKLHQPAGYHAQLQDGVKLHAAMIIIQQAMRSGEKTLLFSMSTKLLDFFEVLIAQYNVAGMRDGDLMRPVRLCRLDGSSTSAQRAEMLKTFDKPNGPDVFLLSTKAGGVGITITAATRVILVDTSFNPADDQQAIGRAYRYGQTRPVYVYRLVCLHTLEYSIFEQKLAKEWLFQTIVDENSVKRDGLSGHGMHLRQIFDLMDRTVEKLQAPVQVTAQQAQQTADAIQEDPVLGALHELLISAQRYEFFLERDSNDTYGEKEKAYYNEYQEQRPFNVAQSSEDDAHWRSGESQAQRAAQLEAEQMQLRHQSRSLTSLVDQLIRSRVHQDPNLSRLLAAMGVQMDPATGTVQTTGHLEAQQERLRQEQQQQRGARGEEEVPARTRQQTLDASLVRASAMGSRAAHPSQQQPRVVSVPEVLSDSDVEELAVLMTPTPHDETVQATNSASQRALARPPLVTNPNRYAQYAPGRSPATAIELDVDGDNSRSNSQTT